MYQFDVSPAIVVGACGHGLAIVRGLHDGKVPTLLLESDTSLPGFKTRCATVVQAENIHGEALISTLLDLRKRIECPGKPVLFLANDGMVKALGTHWELLDESYSLSWSACRHALLPLLEKSALEAHCLRQHIAYPKTSTIGTGNDVEHAIETIGFPIIVKPSRPLSKFKTFIPSKPEELKTFVTQFTSELPFIAQRYIAGTDECIHFSALYLDQGDVVARFDGRKIRSRPLGHTTIAESCIDEQVYAETLRFFKGLALSGPVSLELKRDPEGKLWVIEPTLGRTDFWIGLCIANGVNLPLVEYHHQSGKTPPAQRQTDRAVWFNEERDPFGRVWFANQVHLQMKGRRATYLFLNTHDLAPMWRFLRLISQELSGSLCRLIRRRIKGITT